VLSAGAGRGGSGEPQYRLDESLDAGGDVNYEGASGSHEFDANGDVPGTIVEMAIQDGKWVEVGVALPAS